MLFSTLWGPTFISHFFFWAACSIVAGDFCATAITIFYQRFWYEKALRPKFASNYLPRCSIIIPCKGNSKNLKSNLESFFSLDFPDYEVLFPVEQADDGAAATIEEVIRAEGKGRMVIAGHSTTCAQKNHNLLAAITAARSSDVYVFADSDVRPKAQWLRELVLPLGNPGVTVTSGFRWLHACKGTIAEWMHAYANIFIYVTFSCAFFTGGVGLWGGSMAIRRRDFETLGVANKWSAAAVDDLSLSQIIYKNRLRGVIVPTCMAHSDELLTTVNDGMNWFSRQIMFLRIYFKAIWFFLALPIVVMSALFMALLPIALLLSLLGITTFFGCGGGAAFVFLAGELITVSLYPLLGPMPRFHRFLLVQPYLRAIQAISFFRTCTTNTITWAGVRYTLKFFGDVVKVERPARPS